MISPQVSVVVPTHGGRFLRETVESVRAQTRREWELIVVDDGSRDGSAGVAASLAAVDSRIRVIRQENAGIAAARNRGWRAISPGSRYVAFLDHDDRWVPATLEILIGQLVAHPFASAAHGMATCIDEEGRPTTVDGIKYLPSSRLGIAGRRLVAWPEERPTEFANLVYEDCIVSVGSVLIRRETLDSVGELDTRAETADDYDLWLRLSRQGEIRFVREVVLSYRIHNNRTSLRPAPPRGQGTPYVRYKAITSAQNTPEQRRLAIAGFRAQQLKLFKERWSDLRSSLTARSYRAAGEQLTAAGIRILAYLRGRPYAWHR